MLVATVMDVGVFATHPLHLSQMEKIDNSVRLPCALQYFGGEKPYDIIGKYGISHAKMMYSVWYIVEAANKVEKWVMEYPQNQEKQIQITADFKEKSSVNFGVCAGTIDGILMWIQKPAVAEAKRVGVDQQHSFLWQKTQVLVKLSGSL